MDQTKVLELEILLTLRNHKVVPTRKVPELFDQNWDRYRTKFNDLLNKRFFKVSTRIPGIYAFELNLKGNEKIVELLTDRAKEVESRIYHLNKVRHTSLALIFHWFSKL